MVEANENELKYRRKGKDATAVFDAEGSRAASLDFEHIPRIRNTRGSSKSGWKRKQKEAVLV